MKRSLKLCAVTLVLVLSLAVGLTTLTSAQVDEEVNMVVSPNVLNLESNGGTVSLHVDFAYSSVSTLDLKLNDLPLPYVSTFPDSRGDLVVKCDIAVVKGMVEVGNATFALKINDLYPATDTIRVIEQYASK